MLAQEALRSEELKEIQKHFSDCSEWLLSFSETSVFAMQQSEIEIDLNGDKLILSCPTTRGWENWIILSWEKSGDKLIFQTARKLRSDARTLEFTPRISIANLRQDRRVAQLAQARNLAENARKTFSKHAAIERISLSQNNQSGKIGTTARILLRLPNNKTIAVCGSVVEKSVPANLLANAILWVTKLEERRSISELWLVGEHDSIEDLQKICALLRNGWRERIKIYEREANSNHERFETQTNNQTLSLVQSISVTDLWLEKPNKQLRARSTGLSQTAETILELAPGQIDIVRSKHGETLRFDGLPFVRIRRIWNEEKVWFGVDAKKKTVLNDDTLPEFSDLLENLRAHRRFDANDKRHAFYKAAPEAWLESMLRRDVTSLDPNLVLAPVHAQFRLSNKSGSLDLLAARTDGQLVLIELKTTTDREHVFQAINYWRQIELMRRHNNFKSSKLFGDLPILNQPPLVYLVAPLMSFHRDFEVLANAIMPEIEIWRFDLNEDWRGGIRVARRASDFTKQNDTRFL